MTHPVDKQMDVLYRKWRRLGWAVDAKPHDGHVDPEALIIETTHAGRYDDRLLMWLLTWVRDYGDLINTKRLLRRISMADGPVLGAVFDIAMAHGADHNFRTVTEKCEPYRKPQVLFHEMAAYETMRDQEVRKGLDVYRKWGLHCSVLSFYDDARATRAWVLNRNPWLAIRALLGTNIRAEIVFHLQQRTGIAIQTLAKAIEYAYSAVHKEVASMVKNGLIIETPGRKHLLRLSERTKLLFNVLPTTVAGQI